MTTTTTTTTIATAMTRTIMTDLSMTSAHPTTDLPPHVVAPALGSRTCSKTRIIDPAGCVSSSRTNESQAYATYGVKGFSDKYFSSQCITWARLIRRADSVRPILFLLPEELTRPANELAVKELNDELKNVQLIKVPSNTVKIPPQHALLMKEAENCCGDKEFSVLALWMLPYDRVLYMETDTRLLSNVDELFNCDVDFMATIGPWSPLNGGVFLLRPRISTFEAMQKQLESTKYNHETCWGGLGCPKPFKPGWKRGFGSEGPQGFLEYFFFCLGAERELNTAKMDMGTYNYQVCGQAIAGLLKLEPRLWKGCRSPATTKILHKCVA